MLLSILFLLNGPPADGIQRFQDFVQRNKCFSVQIKTKSDRIPLPGKGSFVVLQPESFRLVMDWGMSDYTYVKGPSQSIEYERYRKTYQEYPRAKGLDYDESYFAASQMDSLPASLIAGDLRRFVPSGTAYKLVSKANGVETYRATWETPDSSGKVVAGIGPDGRLLHFDHFVRNPMSQVHRISDFSDYVLNPKLTPNTFSTVPPLGFTTYQFPYPEQTVNLGEVVHLGTWQSSTGPADMDAAARGKLVVVREPDSEPADALLKYLGQQKLPVDLVVLSLATSGGQFWSPPAKVAQFLSTYGTPFMILVGQDGKSKAMWLGFDAEHPDALLKAITEAAKEKSR